VKTDASPPAPQDRGRTRALAVPASFVPKAPINPSAARDAQAERRGTASRDETPERSSVRAALKLFL
jgi:hypothetical protein